MPPDIHLRLLTDAFAICRLGPEAPTPAWATGGAFVSITRTDEELSIVCRESDVPTGSTALPGWRCLKVEGPLDPSLVGILAGLSDALAQAGIALFAVSTYDTDYLLVRQVDAARAVQVLNRAGYLVSTATDSG